MIAGFACRETETPGLWEVKFPDPSAIMGLTTPEHLQDVCRRYERVLLVGVFSWSNYSRTVVSSIQENGSWFERNGIGLTAFCLENPDQAEWLCPGFSSYYFRANTEPALVLLVNDTIAKVRFGPIAIEEIKRWIAG